MDPAWRGALCSQRASGHQLLLPTLVTCEVCDSAFFFFFNINFYDAFYQNSLASGNYLLPDSEMGVFGGDVWSCSPGRRLQVLVFPGLKASPPTLLGGPGADGGQVGTHH